MFPWFFWLLQLQQSPPPRVRRLGGVIRGADEAGLRERAIGHGAAQNVGILAMTEEVDLETGNPWEISAIFIMGDDVGRAMPSLPFPNFTTNRWYKPFPNGWVFE